MDFDEIVVKDGPGLCRCCLSEGCYKDLSSEYTWMGENEVYADMLLECFDISISQHSEGPNGPNRLICEVCITRLRDACNFKKQVADCEKKFVDMVGRGEFRPKAVIIYQASPCKAEPETDPVAGRSEDDCETEYLEEDLDFTEEFKNDETLQKIEAEDITVSALPVKTKRGKKRAAPVAKTEKKYKTSKAAPVEEAKSSKSAAKGDNPPTRESGAEAIKAPALSATKRNRLMKRNAILVLESSTVFPFKWHRQNYLCFFCHRNFKDPNRLKEHSAFEHKVSSIKAAVNYLRRDEKVKIDVTCINCRLCDSKLEDLASLVHHLKANHNKPFHEEYSDGLIPYKLRDDEFQCAVCKETFQYFIKLNQHMNEHYGNYICEACGKSFLSQDRLRCHSLSHGSKFRCNSCAENFDSLTQKNNHEWRVHNKARSLKCFHCKESFANYSQRKRHHKTAHKIDVPEYTCPVCGKIFQIMSKLNIHVKEVHVREKNYACTVCDQRFFSKTHVQKHMIKHFGERIHQCEVCKKSYARKQTLKDHMRIHSSDKMYVCAVCPKGFVQNNSFRLHMRVHHPDKVVDQIQPTGTLWDSLAVKRRHNLRTIFNFTSVIPFKWSARYMCFFCGKRFSERNYSSLRKHTKFHGPCLPDNKAIEELVNCNDYLAVKVDVSDITCELCNRSFPVLDEIIAHLGTHRNLGYVTNVNVNLEPYNLATLSCLSCTNKYVTFSRLQLHSKRYHWNNLSICSICGDRFNCKVSLSSHIVDYHNPGSFICKLCPQTFSSKNGLECHVDFVHDSTCQVCLLPFPTPKLKEKHVNAKHVTKFKCFACAKSFGTKNSLKVHTKRCYTLKSAMDVKVLEDDNDDNSKEVVKNMRVNMHNILNMSSIVPFKWFMNRFRCFYCQLDFNESERLREHSITHHVYCDIKSLKRCKGEQGEVKIDTSSLVCKECSTIVDNLDQLISHLVETHKLEYDKSAGTSFQEFKLSKDEILCPFCSEKFTFFGNILKHINDKHFEKNFVCTYCGLYFCKEVNLRGHVASQHNIGLQCSVCSETLPNRSKLIIHMANMHEAKISKCSMCSQSFKSPYIRTKHMVEKHNLEYKCKYCTKYFAKKSFLHKHIQQFHAAESKDSPEASTSGELDLKSVKKEPKSEDDGKDDIDLLSILNSVEDTDANGVDEAPYVRKHSNQTNRRKRNMQLVLNMSNAMPFKWFLSSFRCFYCTKNFNDPLDLKQHCTADHSYYDLKKALKRYKGENTTVKIDITLLSCRICSMAAADLTALIDHLILQHQADYDKSLTDCFMPFRLVKDNMICLVCDQTFSFFGHLLIHSNEHHQTKEHICSFCGLTFSKFVNLRAHVSNRHRENSHHCTECSSMFQTKPRLLTHMARYHGVKVSKCRQCSESFTTPYMRSKHMVEKHNLEFKCSHCDKVFPKNSIMKTHIRRVHLRERNVQCDVCSEKFFDNVLLRLHMVKHKGVRNFKCDYCAKTFLWLKNLKAHIKAHTKGVPEQSVC